MALKPVEIDGRTIAVDVDDDGEFWATVDGDRYTAPTLKALTEKLRRQVRTHGRVEVPVTSIEVGWRADNKVEIEHLVLTGIHSTNRNLLGRSATTRKGGVDQLRGRDLYRRLTETEIKTIRAMYAQKKKIEQEIEDWLEVRKADGRALIEQAQAKLLGEQK